MPCIAPLRERSRESLASAVAAWAGSMKEVVRRRLSGSVSILVTKSEMILFGRELGREKQNEKVKSVEKKKIIRGGINPDLASFQIKNRGVL